MEQCFTADERAMLVRYCTGFTRDSSLAEDLTQQALLEAWWRAERLFSPEVRTSWLLGVARNVCLRWARRERVEQARLESISQLSDGESELEDEVDLEEDFERQELAQFVEKAVALLPEQTRKVLVQYYIEAMPQAEVAAHLGVTVGAVEARLNRGKRMLRHLLTYELREEAESLGFIRVGKTFWQDTRIWCPICGQRQVQIQLPKPPGTIAFRCPGCDSDPQAVGAAYPLSNPRFVAQLANLTQPRAIQRRFMSWSHSYFYTAATQHGMVECAQCGRERRLHIVLPAQRSQLFRRPKGRYGLCGECTFCGWQDFCSPVGIMQGLPIVQRFWRDHPRMHLVWRESLEEVAGRAALVATFESVTGSAQLDILLAQETLTLIDVHANVF